MQTNPPVLAALTHSPWERREHLPPTNRSSKSPARMFCESFFRATGKVNSAFPTARHLNWRRAVAGTCSRLGSPVSRRGSAGCKTQEPGPSDGDILACCPARRWSVRQRGAARHTQSAASCRQEMAEETAVRGRAGTPSGSL